MGRENCMMNHCLGENVFCGYFDCFYMKCGDVKKCPEGLDSEDFEDFEDGINYESD